MSIPLITTTAGALAFLESAYNWQQTFAPQNWNCWLFINNYFVTDASDVANFSLANTYGLVGIIPTWAAAAIVGGVPTIAGSTIVWTSTGGWPITCYGIVVLDGDGTHMIGASNFTAPVILTAGSPSYSAQVNVTTKSEF